MAGADGFTVLWRLSFKQQFLRIIVDFSEIVTLNVGKEGKHADKLAQEITFQDPVYLIFIWYFLSPVIPWYFDTSLNFFIHSELFKPDLPQASQLGTHSYIQMVMHPLWDLI